MLGSIPNIANISASPLLRKEWLLPSDSAASAYYVVGRKTEENCFFIVMDIKLSTKDADFIIKIIRSDLERINDSHNRLVESQKRFNESVKESGVKSLMVKAVAYSLNEDTKNILLEEEAIRNDLLKCIELLTMGSYE